MGAPQRFAMQTRGLMLKELAASVGLSNYRSVTTVISNFERWMRHDSVIQHAASIAKCKDMTPIPRKLKARLEDLRKHATCKL